MEFDRGLAFTIDWYRTHSDWMQRIKTGEYRRFYEMNYATRG